MGRRVLVTRTRERAAGLVDALHAEGAEVVVVPLLTTVVLATPDEVLASIDGARAAAGARVDATAAGKPLWALFTSATAVRLAIGVLGPEPLRSLAVAAVGPATAAELEASGVRPALVAKEASADGLAAELRRAAAAGDAVVWMPAARGAADAMAEKLSHSRIRVVGLDLYESDMPDGAPQRLRAALQRPLDGVTLTSGSTARHLVRALEGTPLPEHVLVGCIGRATAAEAAAAGLENIVTAAEPTVVALVDALAMRLGTSQPLR